MVYLVSATFLDVTPCGLVRVYQNNVLLPSSGSKSKQRIETNSACLGYSSTSEGGSGTFFGYIGKRLPDYTVSHP
jgi:hypothetical protein